MCITIKFFLAGIYHRTRNILHTVISLKIEFSLNVPHHFLLWRFWAMYPLLFSHLEGPRSWKTGDYETLSDGPRIEPLPFQTGSE